MQSDPPASQEQDWRTESWARGLDLSSCRLQRLTCICRTAIAHWSLNISKSGIGFVIIQFIYGIFFRTLQKRARMSAAVNKRRTK